MNKLVWIALSLIATASAVAAPLPLQSSTAIPIRSVPTISFDVTPTTYTVPLDSIIRIQCGDHLGTAEVINGNTLITASHVIGGEKLCKYTDGSEQVVQVSYDNPALDYAIIVAPTGARKRIPMRCDGFKTGEYYMMIGYAHGTDFAIQVVRATDEYIDSHDFESKSPFAHVRTLEGKSAIPGMSGGPIFNLRGEMVGTTIAAPRDPEYKLAYARELRDTNICEKRPLSK